MPLTDSDLTELGQLMVIWPLSHVNWDPPKMVVADPPSQAAASSPVPETAAFHVAASKASRIDPLARLRKLPVTVSVRLTERRISMSQLLAITPGALLTFSKSCDDLLDLYVNNALYCRGEAVKIGESFGLKINEVGVRVERESKILDS
ncbi:MAG: hypothetical protein B7Z55_16740 [Planctomycetales bacterium 12-60-4]|nr:MAG: hypothetical protein B7Z55_16740 [Planctomycetales bacterium 12-60-4]